MEKTPRFFLLPETHKQLISGRPVISSVNCHNSSISASISYTLQPEVEKLASYVKDTTDFIKKVENLRLPNCAILFTIDAPTIYTNIINPKSRAINQGILSAGLQFVCISKHFYTMKYSSN